MRNFTLLIGSILLLQPLAAQVDISVVASDLRGPVGIEADESGNLWIAESGSGEDDGAVSVIWADGSVERVIDNLPSFFDPSTGEVAGPTRVLPLNEKFLAVFSGEVPDSLGSSILIYYIDSIQSGQPPLGIEDRANAIDIGTTVLDWGFDNSNPFSLVHDGSDMYIVDAGANSILHRDGLTGVLEVFVTFPDLVSPLPGGPPFIDPVPTRLLAKPGGGFLVSQLTGFPFLNDLAKIYDVSPDKEVSVLDSNLTLVTDLRYHPSGEGLLALQFAQFNGDSMPPFVIGSSMITYLHEDGSRDTVATGFGPSAGMVVTSDTVIYATELIMGTVIRMGLMSTDIDDPEFRIDRQLHLYPNPAREEINVSFQLEQSGNVRLKVFETSGRLVQEMDLGRLPAGEQLIPLSASRFHSGGAKYYFIRLDGENVNKVGTVLIGE